MYSLLHVHTNNSLLDGFGSPKANVKRAKEIGLKALSITDHGTVAGHLAHLTECKKAGIKPILGIETYVSLEPAPLKLNRNNTHMVMWAKNKVGLMNLWKMSSLSNTPEYFYYKPRIQLENWINPETKQVHLGIENFVKDGSVQAFSGHQGSMLSDNLFADIYGDPKERENNIKSAYAQKKGITDPSFYKKFLKPNWLESNCELALKLESIFGKGNFFIELQNELDPNDKLALWIHPVIVECLREVSKQTGIITVASSDPHYPSKTDAQDQRIMVSTNMGETEESISEKFENPHENDIFVFFGSDNFYIHSYEEMAQKFTKEELENTNKIADGVEIYDLAAPPYIPNFEIPNYNKNQEYLKEYTNESDKYLMYLCVEGAKRLKPWLNSEYSREDYWNRLLDETKIIFKFGLSNYFLIVQDICAAADFRPIDHSFDWQKNLDQNGDTDSIPRGIGRGSGAGCMISYLSGITGIDPLKYHLLFSRFFNTGRFSEGNISLPDLDLDFAVKGREWIFSYIRYKYGEENVSQIITFQTMKGRAAIKDVFRVKNIANAFDIANDICKHVPDEATIADEIQEAKEAGDQDYNILRWTLDNSEQFLEYYNQEELKPLIDQAMRCEGTKRGQGKHPSGVVISPKPIAECFPVTLDTKTKQPLVGVDMRDAEKLGALKLDILGTVVLDKLQMVENLYNRRKKK